MYPRLVLQRLRGELVVTDTRGRLNIDAGPGQWNLSGSIDETSALIELLSRAQHGSLVRDLAGVTFINSLGVRDWIRMQNEATRQGLVIELRRVSVPFFFLFFLFFASCGFSRV